MSHPKIIGFENEPSPGAQAADETDTDFDDAPPFAMDDGDAVYETQYEANMDGRLAGLWLPVLIVLLGLGWTGFYVWANRAVFAQSFDTQAVGGLISAWAIPVMLLALVWLLALRTSTREARRFSDSAASLGDASFMLEERMQSVNSEISLAREFLAQQTREIDTLGRHSAQTLAASAREIEQAFEESSRKAEELDRVSQAANGNLERLRKHMPVITGSAKDITNQIASAGSGAQQQLEALTAGLSEVERGGHEMRGVVEALIERSDQALAALTGHLREADAGLSGFAETAQKTTSAMSARLSATTEVARAGLEDASARQRELAIESAEALRTQLDTLDAAMVRIGEVATSEEQRLAALVSGLDEDMERVSARIDALDRHGSDKTAKLAFALSALLENSRELGGAMVDNDEKLAAALERAESTLDTLRSNREEIDERLPESLGRLDKNLAVTLDRLKNLGGGMSEIGADSDKLLEQSRAHEENIKLWRTTLSTLIEQSETGFSERQRQADALSTAIVELRETLDEVALEADEKLGGALQRVQQTARETAEHTRIALDDVVEKSAQDLAERSERLLSQAVAQNVENAGRILDSSIGGSVALSEELLERLTAQAGKLDDMTANLERRLHEAHESFDGIDEDAFARRVSLLTESLNSTAIDVAKLLSNEVTDTAWASYLKGDRGVFTRRAVRLLDAGEVKIVAQHYEQDPEFRDQVNRYIHDFESIMRNLLSTRDGSAIGVTLLSSDVGKLYVALAQAIERLRT